MNVQPTECSASVLTAAHGGRCKHINHAPRKLPSLKASGTYVTTGRKLEPLT